MEYPSKVRKAAQWYLDRFGERLRYIGTKDNYAYYKFSFPNDMESGFPVVFKFDGFEVESINGFDALHIINSFL